MTTRRLTAALAAALALTALTADPALAQFHGPGEMMGGMGWMMWGAWLFGILFWVAVFVLLVVVIWKLVGAGGDGDRGSSAAGSGSGGEPGPRGETPLAILERRYAAGEIDRDEFLRKREDLRAG